MYANIKRYYNGRRTLLEATMRLPEIVFNYDFSCGRRGYWKSKPVIGVESNPVYTLPPPLAFERRDIQTDMEWLAWQVSMVIDRTWRKNAFHVVFHSSGHDSRIMSSAIKRNVEAYGKEWLGRGLLFLSNRWEADKFKQVMEAQGWDKEYWLAYIEGDDDEHFARAVYNMHNCAPCPIPGNLWYYLPRFAIEKGRMPRDNIQAFAGLWANEAWDCFLMEQNPWVKRINKQYGHHVMASLPVLANSVEYPLVSHWILKAIQYMDYTDGKKLRRDLANYMCPEAKSIKRGNTHDRKHLISVRMQNELDEYYKQTYFGSKAPWTVPGDSEFSPDWGRWSLALLAEELKIHGKKII